MCGCCARACQAARQAAATTCLACTLVGLPLLLSSLPAGPHRAVRGARKRATKHGSGVFSGGEEGSQPFTTNPLFQPAEAEEPPPKHAGGKEATEEGAAPLRRTPTLPLQPSGSGLRRSSSFARLQRGAGQAEEGEASMAGRMSAKQSLLAQPAAAPGGLRHSKSFGGHLADLMQARVGPGGQCSAPLRLCAADQERRSHAWRRYLAAGTSPLLLLHPSLPPAAANRPGRV